MSVTRAMHVGRGLVSGLVLALLVGSGACFLPPWEERPWADDDDATGDDDTTGDDDDTTPSEIEFQGELDISVTYPGVVNSGCQTHLDAEYDIEDYTLDGETSCTIAQMQFNFELDCEIAASMVGGFLEISDSGGSLPFNLEADVTGTYDAEAGTIVADVDLNWYGVIVTGTIDLQEI